MPRIARICAVGYPHHITQRGNNKQPVFFDDEDRQFYLKTLLDYSLRYDLDVWSYCLMTNHLHLLAVPKKQASLARGIGGTNLVYTQYINRKKKRSGRLWQNRFFSTTIEQDPYLWAVSRYIEHNPVRAGIVEKAQQYKWSSCRAHISDSANIFLTLNDWLENKDISSYKNFLREDDTTLDNSIINATKTGRPLGGTGFLKKLEEAIGPGLNCQKSRET